MIHDIFRFNRDVVGISPRPLAPFSPGEKQWMLQVLTEEVTELRDAETAVDQVDALIDSVIFALGGLYRLGLTEEQAQDCVNAVLDANFSKKAGAKPGRVVEGVKDVIKPGGWVGPEARIAKILGAPNV